MYGVCHSQILDTRFIAACLHEARVVTRVFETGQKASDQTFAKGRLEACCEGVPLYLHSKYRLLFGYGNEHKASCKGKASPMQGWCFRTFPEEPEPTSQLYRTMDWCFLHVRWCFYRPHSCFYNIFICQEVKNDVQIQLVAGPDGGADAWLDCSLLHAT